MAQKLPVILGLVKKASDFKNLSRILLKIYFFCISRNMWRELTGRVSKFNWLMLSFSGYSFPIIIKIGWLISKLFEKRDFETQLNYLFVALLDGRDCCNFGMDLFHRFCSAAVDYYFVNSNSYKWSSGQLGSEFFVPLDISSFWRTSFQPFCWLDGNMTLLLPLLALAQCHWSLQLVYLYT